MSRERINTREVTYKGKKYCAYCGEVLKSYEHYYGNHGRDSVTFYNCDCTGANLEIDFIKRAKTLEENKENALKPFLHEGDNKIRDIQYNDMMKQLHDRISKLDYQYSNGFSLDIL